MNIDTSNFDKEAAKVATQDNNTVIARGVATAKNTQIAVITAEPDTPYKMNSKDDEERWLNNIDHHLGKAINVLSYNQDHKWIEEDKQCLYNDVGVKLKECKEKVMAVDKRRGQRKQMEKVQKKLEETAMDWIKVIIADNNQFQIINKSTEQVLYTEESAEITIKLIDGLHRMQSVVAPAIAPAEIKADTPPAVENEGGQ